MILYLMYSWCYKHFSILLNFNELIAFQKLPSSTLFLPPAVLDLCRCMGSPLISECGATLYFGVQASRCCGFPCRRAWALGCTGSVAVTRGLRVSQPLEHSLNSWALCCSGARGIFLDRGLNLCPLHWQTDSLSPSHQASPAPFFIIRSLTLIQWTWTWETSGRWWKKEEPGVLQSLGLQRVGHDLATG